MLNVMSLVTALGAPVPRVAKDAHKARNAQKNERAERNEGAQRLVAEKVGLGRGGVGKDGREGGDHDQDRQARKNHVVWLFLHGEIVPLCGRPTLGGCDKKMTHYFNLVPNAPTSPPSLSQQRQASG